MPKKVTVRDVAKAADVSPATASRALSGAKVSDPLSEERRKRVLEAAERLNYVGRAAPTLSKRNTRTIGLIVPELTNPFFAELAQTMSDRLRNLGYQSIVSLATDKYDKDFELACVQTLIRRRVDGIIAVPASTHSAKVWGSLRGSPTKFVLVDRDLDDTFPGIDSVTVNNRAGAKIATAHLLESGHTLIGYLTGPDTASTLQQRLLGYRDAFAEAGLTPDERYIQECTFAIGSRHDAARRLLALDPTPTAIFAPSNLLCESALVAIRERDMRVPTDISLIMFDDVHWATFANPPLTTVRNPPKNLGRAAVDLLVRRLSEDTPSPAEQIKLQVAELVVRQSTRAAKAPVTAPR